jgi:hypothetical protein
MNFRLILDIIELLRDIEVFMNSELYKPQFTGSALSKLIGISVTQFNTLRNCKLLETKDRYSLQDVFYVAFCNDFKIRGKKSWLTVLKNLLSIFKSLDNVKNLDFLNYDILALHFYGEQNHFEYKSIDNPFIREFILNTQNTKRAFNIDDSLPEMFDSFCMTIGDLEECYINLLKIRITICENKKELSYQVKKGVENILLSA